MAADQLTALTIERAHRAGLPVFLADGNGLYFRKQTSESAAWTLRYRFAGRRRWLALGSYPDMGLAQARLAARKARVLIDGGEDPMAVRAAQIDAQRGRGTFRELAEAWFAIEASELKHPKVPRRQLDNHLLPEFGSRAAADVRPADIARLLGRVKRTAPTTANDLLRLTKRIFSFGVRRHLIERNPAADFTARDAGGAERSRDRALSRDELAALFAAIHRCPSFGGDNLLALKLLLSLGVRKGELLAARWDEFDLVGASEHGPVWHLPAARTKTGVPLDVPLVPAVVGWLRALQELSCGSEYVFPQRRRDHRERYPHVGLDTLNVALMRVEHGLAPFTLHDLRRTMRTHLAALGVRREVAERSLGHKLPGVEGVYNRHDFFDERRAALSGWTALLVQCERGERKVTPIRRRAAG